MLALCVSLLSSEVPMLTFNCLVDGFRFLYSDASISVISLKYSIFLQRSEILKYRF